MAHCWKKSHVLTHGIVRFGSRTLAHARRARWVDWELWRQGLTHPALHFSALVILPLPSSSFHPSNHCNSLSMPKAVKMLSLNHQWFPQWLIWRLPVNAKHNAFLSIPNLLYFFTPLNTVCHYFFLESSLFGLLRHHFFLVPFKFGGWGWD